MSSPTAVRLADAALEVLGTGGIHALSHARVDATAGVPAGTTSNHFRSRAALVAGAIARLRDLDEQDWRAARQAGRPADLNQLADAFAMVVENATGPQRTRTAARYVIVVQGVVEPALLDALNADRRLLCDWVAGSLTALGVRRSADTAEVLLAAVEGLIMHRLTGFSDEPAGPRLRRLVAGLCTPAVRRPSAAR